MVEVRCIYNTCSVLWITILLFRLGKLAGISSCIGGSQKKGKALVVGILSLSTGELLIPSLESTLICEMSCELGVFLF